MANLGAPETGSASSEPMPAAASKSGATSLRGIRRALLVLLHLLPKNAMSRLMGRVTAIPLPGPLQRGQIRVFAWLAGVDLLEMRDGLEAFSSLQQFFTRALRADARPIEGDEDCLVSPCDGAWGESGRIESGTMLQVKGRTYRVSDFLGDESRASAYEGGCYATFYLSPRDYHRFHTPTAGRITRLDYHPGALWPVNSIGLDGIDGLFARNERICAYLEPTCEGRQSAKGGAALDLIALVAVGATMVGSVRLSFHEMTTNESQAVRVSRDLGEKSPVFGRGEEWGYFEFGSTIVMLTPPGEIEINFRSAGEPLRLGEAIGRLRT